MKQARGRKTMMMMMKLHTGANNGLARLLLLSGEEEGRIGGQRGRALWGT